MLFPRYISNAFSNAVNKMVCLLKWHLLGGVAKRHATSINKLRLNSTYIRTVANDIHFSMGGGGGGGELERDHCRYREKEARESKTYIL